MEPTNPVNPRSPMPPAGEALYAVAAALDADLARPEESGGALTVTVRPGDQVGGTLYIEHAGAVLALCVDTTNYGTQVRVRCYGPRDFHVMRREVVDRFYRERAAHDAAAVQTHMAARVAAR